MSLAKSTIVITGANRGLGLGLCRQFLKLNHRVIAGARNPQSSSELQKLSHDYSGDFFVDTLDVESELSVKGFAAKCEAHAPIDILINNAGLLLDADKNFYSSDLANIEKMFRVNTIGPMRVAQNFVRLMNSSKNPRIINMSTMMASIEDNRSGGYYGYRMSKAALNMMHKNLTIEFPSMICIAMHPGWVETDMGGPRAPLSIEESTSKMTQVILELRSEHTGKFLDYRGQMLPW